MAALYADENVVMRLVELLRAMGHDVLRAFDDGRANRRIGDPLVLARDVSLRRAILTNNRRDYHRLHRIDPLHAGIITYTDDPDRAALAARIDAAIAGRSVLDGLLLKVIRPNNLLANRKPRIIPGSTSP